MKARQAVPVLFLKKLNPRLYEISPKQFEVSTEVGVLQQKLAIYGEMKKVRKKTFLRNSKFKYKLSL